MTCEPEVGDVRLFHMVLYKIIWCAFSLMGTETCRGLQYPNAMYGKGKVTLLQARCGPEGG